MLPDTAGNPPADDLKKPENQLIVELTFMHTKRKDDRKK